ncbi:MAG: FHA domain-containing protein [Deltaproteobacteria bacterium]|nr:FHA domain-containing protein [Deltaproteobacteria bacterium]
MEYLLEVTTGAERGERHKLPLGSYVVIGRAGNEIQHTVQMAAGGDRLLGDELLAIAERHIAARSDRGSSPHRLGVRKRMPDIDFADAGISRNHAMVFHDQQGVSIVDLMSTNGTHVNDAIVADADLRTGDVIRVGRTELRLLVVG